MGGTPAVAPVPDPGIDSHVHLLPDRLMRAVRDHFVERGWQFDRPVDWRTVDDTLRRHGVERYFALPYAHRAGVAHNLNEWVLERAADSEMVVPFACVHGDDDVHDVVASAVADGARGLKIHCPVQESSPVDPRLDPAFELAAEHGLPIVFHAGTAPYSRDSDFVGAAKFETFLESYPSVNACAAHVGTFESDTFFELARTYDNAYLDTAFAMSSVVTEYIDFDPATVPDDVLVELSDSIMYGSDFPSIPYPYSREREHLLSRSLDAETTADIFGRTALAFLGE